MFPLKKRIVEGYSFGQRTFYGTKHTGTDYKCSYENYYAPFDGYATAGRGFQGGTWWTLTRPNGHQITVRHLSKLIKVGNVREGELVAVTGNSGAFTTNPHAHKEVEVGGKLIDPEKYDWEETMKLVNDKGTIYLVTGNKDKRKIGIADLKSLGLFGDEPQRFEDTKGIPQYNVIVNGNTIK